MSTGLNLTTIREAIYKRLPEEYESNSHMLKAIDTLITDNGNDMFDEEETVTLFVEKFFSGMSKLDIAEMGDVKYAYACKFVSYRMLGLTEGTAFELTYPDRASEAAIRYDKEAYIKSMTRRGRMMSKDAMVIKIMDFSSIPLYVTNAPLVQAAMDKLEDLMENSHDDKVQLGAAQAILTELRKPDAIEVEHSVDEGSIVSTLDAFRQMNKELANTSSKMILDGKATLVDVDAKFKKQIAHKEL